MIHTLDCSSIQWKGICKNLNILMLGQCNTIVYQPPLSFCLEPPNHCFIVTFFNQR